MREDIYRRLQERLDSYSTGFPATDSGIEIKILKRIFSKEDAELFLNLTLKLETPEEIAGRLGMLLDEVIEKLKDMTDRCLLYSEEKDGQIKYGAMAFAVGILEANIELLGAEGLDFIELCGQYFGEAFGTYLMNSISESHRYIPVQQSVDLDDSVACYEDIIEIFKRTNTIAVTACSCRKIAVMMGGGCGKPLETCFFLGPMAEYYLKHKLARKIDINEALEIMDEARKAGLVTMPSSLQNPYVVCNCCGCCCGALAFIKMLPKPVEKISSNHFAEVDQDLCSGCETCMERCQMDAITMDDQDLAVIDNDRCIGCGLCVTECPTEALKLKLKPEEQRRIPPDLTYSEALEHIGKKRGF